MGTVRLGLELPSTHHIYSDYNGDSSSEPISASILLTTQTDAELLGLSRMQVSLVLVLSTSSRDGMKENEQLSSRIFRLLSVNPQSSTSQITQHSSILEELTLCVPIVLADSHVGYSPEKGNIYKIPFFVPVPANIPGTTATDLGSISTFLVASITTANGKVVGTSEEINVVHRIIPESDPIQHTRAYQTSKVVKSVTLAQSICASTHSNLSLLAKVSLRRPAAPTVRATEFKCVAIRGIQWCVEEVTKVFNKRKDYHQSQDENISEYEPVENESFTRELFHGYQKGYWGTPDNPIIKEQQPPQEKDSTVEIAFDIEIPKYVTPAPEVGLACYNFDSRPTDHLPPCLRESISSTTQEKLMITVEHRLKLDILTSEDTFGVNSKNLVERKPLQTALNASFPLRIVQKAQDGYEAMGWQASPPRYTEIPASPPVYKPIL